MRLILRSIAVVALGTIAWATALVTFVSELVFDIGTVFLKSLIWSAEFIPRLLDEHQPLRRIWMAATALNDRLLGGVRISGFLGQPAVRMLTG